MSGQATAGERAGAHLERFDLDGQGGRLIDAEHRGRYWWAAQLAPGKDVLDAACGTGYGSEILKQAGAASITSADLSAEAIEATTARLGDAGNAVVADIRELPFADDSFDLVVSWETIEHVEDGERVIAEFRRVLRPDGVLLVSSPNPAVYPEGNEHHVHEYSPAELEEMVRGHFAKAATHRQHAWLASVIDAADPPSDDRPAPDSRAVSELAEGMQTYSLVVASDAELPSPRWSITLADAFEVRWWEEQLTATRRLLARIEAEREQGAVQLRDTSAALLEANQRLAQIPVLEHRLEEAHANAKAAIENIESSLSWRITRPLRRFRGLRGR